VPDTQAVSSTIAGTKVTARFEAGEVSGSGGCTTYHGSYETSGASLRLGPVSSTKGSCPSDVEDQELAYLAALADTALYAIDGDQLTLSDGRGQMLLQFSGRVGGM